MDRSRGARGWLHAPWFPALRLGWGLPLMLLIVLPWMVAIGLATEGRFFAQAIGDDMLGKVGQADERHWGPPGYYLATFGIAAFPAGFLVMFALRQSWRERSEPVVRFLLAWAVPSWIVFEIVVTKLPHYVLPLYPALAALNVMDLASPGSAILSAVIFNALIIVALIPLAIKGVRYRPVGAATLLRRNLAIYGLGGLVAPFVGIKVIDMALAAAGLA